MVVSVHPPLVSFSHWVVSSDPMAATVVDDGSVGSGAATAEEASRTATAEAKAAGKIIVARRGKECREEVGGEGEGEEGQKSETWLEVESRDERRKARTVPS